MMVFKQTKTMMLSDIKHHDFLYVEKNIHGFSQRNIHGVFGIKRNVIVANRKHDVN